MPDQRARSMMANNRILRTGIAIVALVSLCVLVARGTHAQEIAQEAATIDFALDIKPIFEAKCVRCHGVDQQEGDFRIDDRDNVMDYVEPGDIEYSMLYELVAATDETQMPPPDEGGPLDADSIDKIRRWINGGANWPETVTIDMPAPEVVEQIKQDVLQVQEQKDRQKGSGQLLLEAIGLLHPVFLHFPVALLIGGALFGVCGFRGDSPMSDAAYYCLWLAAWMSVLACLSGWYFAIDKDYLNWKSFDFNRSIDIHRWGGIVVSALTFLLALVAASYRRRDPYGTGAIWKFSLALLALLTGFVAHHGGKMTHDGVHEKLQNKATILYENLTGKSEAKPDRVEEKTGNDLPATKDAVDDSPKEMPGSIDPTPNAPEEGSGETSEDDNNKDG